MRTVYVVAGAGGMYCGACQHASTLASAMRRLGEDAMVLPAYTPIRTDEEDLSLPRIVYGGVNVYLQQYSSLSRRLPRCVTRLLDHPALLRRLARRSSTTRAEDLGDLTVSMLRGEDGRQREELSKLLDVLAELRPEVVHLSTALLVGMARQLRQRLRVPVVATLSGEDSFLERLPEPHYTQARAALRDRAGDLAALVALSRSYADFAAEYVGVPRERIHVIPPGLNLEGHCDPAPRPATLPNGTSRPIVVGFFSRICEDKGLHHLVDAFCTLAKDASLPPLRLAVGGYLGEQDRPYFERLRARLADEGLHEQFEYCGDVDRAGKLRFLQSLDVFCLPSLLKESKALPVLEAWANGVPAVLPDHGPFAELVEDTGGGTLYAAGDVAALVAALRRMIEDRELAVECGCRARQAVVDRYHANRMAGQTAELYRTLANCAAACGGQQSR